LESLLRHSGLEIIYSSTAPPRSASRKLLRGRASLRKPAESMTNPPGAAASDDPGEEDIDKQVHLFVSAVTRLASSPGSASSCALESTICAW